jgi:hypothetical protein
MTTPSLRRNALLLLCAAVLAAPWPAAASPRKPRVAPAASPSSFDFVSRSWAFLQSFWSEEGCRLDPDGRCLTGPAPRAHTDTGCRLDPNGRCSTGAPLLQSLSAPEGCRLDPNGRCLTGTTPKADTDTGCRLDPDGHCHS